MTTGPTQEPRYYLYTERVQNSEKQLKPQPQSKFLRPGPEAQPPDSLSTVLASWFLTAEI